MLSPDVVVIGAGAAGLMAALRAGQRGRSVLVLDHSDRIGAKILISGGGRCNFTNKTVRAENYQSTNPHFCKSALSSFGPSAFIALIEKHGIAYHEKTLGQLFCDGSAKEIVAMLKAECDAAGVTILLGQTVSSIEKPDRFRITTQNATYETPALILATGGLSIPQLGATSFTYDWARHFGLPLVTPRPALVPLTFDGAELAWMKELRGVALDVIACSGKKSFRENMILTDRGLSGPALLQISSYWQEGTDLTLDLMPDLDATAFLLERKKARPNATLKTILGEQLPQRLAQHIATTNLANPVIGQMTDKELRALAARLKKWIITPSGTEGFAKAEVTAGGVDTHALSSKTMEATQIPGLFIVGEALDVTGWLGGYNLQWAWSSGWSAGSAV